MLLFNKLNRLVINLNLRYFNTSNVTIQLMPSDIPVLSLYDFNTSNVTIQHAAGKALPILNLFQYI